MERISLLEKVAGYKLRNKLLSWKIEVRVFLYAKIFNKILHIYNKYYMAT